MNIKVAGFARVVGILAATAALASPALVNAESHGSGGGHSAHFAARGGGGHAYAGHASAGRAYAGRGYARSYAAPRYTAGNTSSRGYVGSRSYVGSHGYVGSRGWVGRAYAGGRPWGYRPWGGGWWNGYFWPRAYYGWAYPWFLAALPIGYATYWWGGVPYYYINDVYYAWNPADDGYVVTNPPPAAGDSVAYSPPADGANDYSAPPANDAVPPDQGPPPASDAAPPGEGPPPADAAPPPSSSSPDDIYMYPMNGQTAQQQATDRNECRQWAVQQTGFDPTQQASQSSGNAFNFHRAMVACLQGRGYSVN